jgi:hypothetical protein
VRSSHVRSARTRGLGVAAAGAWREGRKAGDFFWSVFLLEDQAEKECVNFGRILKSFCNTKLNICLAMVF